MDSIPARDSRRIRRPFILKRWMIPSWYRNGRVLKGRLNWTSRSSKPRDRCIGFRSTSLRRIGLVVCGSPIMSALPLILMSRDRRRYVVLIVRRGKMDRRLRRILSLERRMRSIVYRRRSIRTRLCRRVIFILGDLLGTRPLTSRKKRCPWFEPTPL